MINKQVKLRYLEQLSRSELAYWLIHSFSPDRYADINDHVKEATELLGDDELSKEFVFRLFGMFGQSTQCGHGRNNQMEPKTCEVCGMELDDSNTNYDEEICDDCYEAENEEEEDE